MFKYGIQITNSRVVMEDSKKITENEDTEKIENVQKAQKKETSAT